MNTDRIYESRYLDFLGIGLKKPSREFLEELVQIHLAKVPYENISKLLHFKRFGPTLPSFEDYINQMTGKGMGGTCFAQNIYLNRLLNFLGFDSRLIGLRREGPLSHVSLRVRLDSENYFVDVGIMSSIAGPYLLHPSAAFVKWVGNSKYIYKPSDDLENYAFEIHRDEKMIRSFQSSSLRFSDEELATGIQETFKHGAMFMTTLCVHRAYTDYSIGLWNRQLYKNMGTETVKREVSSIEELRTVFRDELNLPNYPVDEALMLLRENGAEPLFGAPGI